MDNLDQVSDDELRRRLLQYGLPNLPVTSTTRKILIKKLRLIMEGEKSKLRRETAYATRYSSDEDTPSSPADSREKAAGGRSKATRATIATVAGNRTNTPSAFVRPTNSPMANLSSGNRNSLNARTPPTSSAKRLAQRSPVYVSPLLQGSGEESDEDMDYTDNRSPAKPTSNRTPLNNNSPNFTMNSSPTTPTNGKESPYLSDFTQRLLNLRGTTVQTESNSRRQIVQPNAVRPQNQHLQRPRYMPANTPYADGLTHQARPSDISPSPTASSAHHQPQVVPVGTAFAALARKLDQLFGFKQSLVPCLLHTGLVLFFVLVGVAYLTINPNLAQTIRAEDAKFTTCPIGFVGAVDADSYFTCIHRDEVEPALELLRQTAVELQRRAELNRCQDATVSYVMGAKEVVKRGLEAAAGHSTVSRIRDQLHHMEYLVDTNPQWGISNCDASGNRLDLDAVRSFSNSQLNYFAIMQPRLPLKCKIYNKIQTFYTIVGTLALVAFVLYAGHFVYTLVVSIRRARKDKVDFLIVDIIQALMEKASAGGNDPDKALVVINHLRDQLIAPADRSKSAWAWKAAITFLEANESRIHFEVGTRNGEDVRMMRWLADPSMGSPRSATSSPNGVRSSGAKKWHCPAFDKTNKIKDPPTPCLKIRHMFESHEIVTPLLRQTIQDAILEKVAGTGCRIFDVQLEGSSCCVYVRCASTTDAGIVHEQINGWWFDSRLVSIKFLHLDRYVSRFPDGLSGPKVLQPSNTNNLSMSACNGIVTRDADEY